MSESAGHMDVSGSTETPRSTKYFTPKMEDIHVGYECEVLPTNESYGWSRATLQFRKGYEDKRNPRSLYNLHPFWFTMQAREGDYAPITIIIENLEHIRTPYLTFEKIISEGWTPLEHDATDERAHWFVNGRCRLRYLPMTPYNIHGYLKIQRGTQFQWHTLFDGNCDSINDFKTILKLL